MLENYRSVEGAEEVSRRWSKTKETKGVRVVMIGWWDDEEE